MCLSAICVAAIGAAQVTKPLGLSLRAGLFWPTSSYGRSVGGTWLGVGADFKLLDLPTSSVEGLPARVSLSIDFYGRGEARAVPVLINITGFSKQTYYSAGVGFSMTEDDYDNWNAGTGGGGGGGGGDTIAPPGTGPGPTPTFSRRRKTNIAYSLALGYNFPSTATPVFVEARFFGHSNNALNALGFYVGVRF
jgi:hypothetical protein